MNFRLISKYYQRHPYIITVCSVVMAGLSFLLLWTVSKYWYPPVVRLDASEIASRVTFNTNRGKIVINLDGEAKFAIGQFTRYVRTGFYTGTKIHHIVPDLLIQGGDPLTKYEDMRSIWGQGGSSATFPLEIFRTDKMTKGTLAMADTGTKTYGSQFFIVTNETAWLEGKATIIGHVVEGMDVLDQISKTEVDMQHTPQNDIVIFSIDEL